MKIYKNKELTQEVVDILDLDIVQAGDTKEKTYYILNDTSAKIVDLNFSLVLVDATRITNDEVFIVEAPTKLVSKEVGELIVKWDASVELEQGIKIGLNITGRRLFE